MSDQARYFKLFCGLKFKSVSEQATDGMMPKGIYLDIESGIKAHGQVPLLIFIEQAQEALLEDGRSERVRKHHHSVCGVGKGFHLE